MHDTYSSNLTSGSDTLADNSRSKAWTHFLRALTSGLLLPLGFAPFHLPGFAILSLTFLFLQLTAKSPQKAFMIGFAFGLGVLGLGTSWVYNSIHTYGHFNIAASGLITLIFIAFFSLYTGFFATIYAKTNQHLPIFCSPFLFSSLWLFSEYFRSTWFTGFSWLLVGFGQLDSPLQHLLPIIGVFGVSWLTALASGFLALAFNKNNPRKRIWLILFVTLLLVPLSFKNKYWTQTHHEPISVGIIQADLSMRDKWDNELYQHIQSYYQNITEELMPKTDLIVMPESSIPLPSTYAGHYLDTIDEAAKAHHSAVLLGIPQPSGNDAYLYQNTLLGLGTAKGTYAKQHLVPFGEYIPKPFRWLTELLQVPDSRVTPGDRTQKPVMFNQYAIASLVCYEVAYPALLRTQLPKAAFIVSISDDGWFGHSLAVYQQLQMAQVLSKQTERFQIVSNNDGLSSLINTQGQIIESLPAFSKGILKGHIYPSTGATPWVLYGDMPLFILNGLIIVFMIGFGLTLAAKKKRSYPSKPSSIC